MTPPEPPVPVIDMWAPFVPSAEIVDDLRAGFPAELLSYLEVFTKTTVTAEQFGEYAESLRRSDDEILDSLDAAGITGSLITGFDEKSTCGVTFVHNDSVAALAARHPDRFLPFAGADIMAGATALDDFERWVVERGFRGLSLRPFMIGRPASDPAYFPWYAKCVELGVPLSIHTSANWTRSRPSDLGHPRHIDDVACRFPELAILMSHGGYPWVLQACLIAWKHPNVYLELAAHRPKYFASPGAGWEPLMRFGQTTIRHKVIYGTGGFLINRPYRQLCDEMRALPVPRDVLEDWLWRNAARLLRLDPPAHRRIAAR
ncbi:amidohydrolase [Mycobacterium shinjukuense]|uniref:Antibiotic resistance protein n=1 Tax=Mycobacterium shinjukuense TaxID=398694 RepID=A0A7I7MLC8_9MYCO|nr:amidohydrolase family protein [Mycobacterium shinjukuense]MCV6984328.1 amidohydrolase [Mycobacterium shinjukuense]ORB70941.1 antibiotic transporter [Mycobacterium shinjukuense]BBX73048.1 antibiotic resistance protein [Mycobacterium shinjukuense]